MTSITRVTSFPLILALIAASCAALVSAAEVQGNGDNDDALRASSKEKQAKWTTPNGEHNALHDGC